MHQAQRTYILPKNGMDGMQVPLSPAGSKQVTEIVYGNGLPIWSQVSVNIHFLLMVYGKIMQVQRYTNQLPHRYANNSLRRPMCRL
jgi:hypothetical protein